MANVYDVANFFIDICNNSADDQITNMKLNKLLYYAQGCHLARHAQPLFCDTIEAWPYGPVTPAIYHKYKVCGKAPISKADDEYKSSVFTPEELETLTDVMREYGKYTGSALVSLTHKSGTPWSDAHAAACTEITQASMQEYFTSHPVPRSGELFVRLPHVDKLPSDWYDPAEDSEWEAYL